MSDVLITLVGLNPIVNYVSILQYCSNESTLFLISTGKQGNNTSSRFADNLKEISQKKLPGIKVEYKIVDKNELKQIYKSARDIVKFIKEKSEKRYEPLEVVLDITGSTKINSAIFYDVFIREFESYKNVNLSISYVSSIDKKVYKTGLRSQCYDLDKLADELRVTKEELLKIQGYCNENNQIERIKSIDSKGFTLVFTFESEIKEPKDIKYHVYFALDLADRFGGNLSEINFIARSYKLEKSIDEDDGKRTLMNKLKNDTNRHLEERLHLKLIDEE